MRLILAGLLLATACGGSTPNSVRRAQTLMAKGDYAGAERTADLGLAQFPKHPTLWRIKIQAPIERGDSAVAVKRYKQWHHLRKHYDRDAMRAMAIATLNRALRATSPAVRREAVRAVRGLAFPRLRKSLVALLSDPDDAVASTTALALLPDNQRAIKTAERLLNSKNAHARATAVIALAAVLKRKQVALDALRDPRPRVRRAGVSALARLGEGRQNLIGVAKTDTDDSVRASAYGALTRFKFAARIDLAKHALTEKYVGSRLAAIRLLRGGGDAAKPILLKLTKSADVLVALRAAVALVHLGGERRPDVVERGLNSIQWPIRAAALNAVGEVATRDEAVRIARQGLADKRMEVRLSAARALARSGMTGAAIGVFQAALDDARESIRITAAIRLLRLDETSGRRALAKLLRSKNAATRVAAVRAYAWAANATLTLVAALADKAPRVRVVAARSLVRLLR